MFQKRLLMPHQYYYPNMNFLLDRATEEREQIFLRKMQEERSEKAATIYVHVPFCNSNCAFCGFDKEYNTEEMEAYTEKVISELRYYAQLVGKKKTIQSVHFGGGTPTLLPAQLLQRILDTIHSEFSLNENTAVDIEGSATTLTREDILPFLKRNHITRVSFGIQSFDEEIRREMKMKAVLQDVYDTIRLMKANDIRIFGDILYGYPCFDGRTSLEILKTDLEIGIREQLDGIELGQMYPFKNELERIVSDRNLPLPTDEDIIASIEYGTELLTSQGYTQSTYSGFTRNGKIILETSYFGGLEEMPDCIAVGSGSYGSIAGVKYRNSSYSVYMSGAAPSYSQIKPMTAEQIENQQIVGFPRVLSVQKELLKKPEVWNRFREKFDALQNEGYITERERTYELTAKGRNYIDNIYWYLLEEEEQEHLRKELVFYEEDV